MFRTNFRKESEMDKNPELGQALIESLLVCLLFVSVLVVADQMVLHQRNKQRNQFIKKYQRQTEESQNVGQTEIK